MFLEVVVAVLVAVAAAAAVSAAVAVGWRYPWSNRFPYRDLILRTRIHALVPL